MIIQITQYVNTYKVVNHSFPIRILVYNLLDIITLVRMKVHDVPRWGLS